MSDFNKTVQSGAGLSAKTSFLITDPSDVTVQVKPGPGYGTVSFIGEIN